MEQVFNLLKSQGNNTADGILKYLKDNNMLDNTTETLAREALSGLSNPNDVTLEKFLEICTLVVKEKGADIANAFKSVLGAFSGPSGQAGQGTSGALADTDSIHDHDEHYHDEHYHDDHDHDDHDHDDHDHDEHDHDEHDHDEHDHDEHDHDEHDRDHHR